MGIFLPSGEVGGLSCFNQIHSLAETQASVYVTLQDWSPKAGKGVRAEGGREESRKKGRWDAALGSQCTVTHIRHSGPLQQVLSEPCLQGPAGLSATCCWNAASRLDVPGNMYQKGPSPGMSYDRWWLPCPWSHQNLCYDLQWAPSLLPTAGAILGLSPTLDLCLPYVTSPFTLQTSRTCLVLFILSCSILAFGRHH